MINFNYKVLTLIFICSFLTVIWTTNLVLAEDYNPDCEIGLDCDADGVYEEDNCPENANPGQQDVDNDGIGDACDEDTIFGYVSGDYKEGIDVNILSVSCSTPTIVATLVTDEDGYYSIGNLEDNWYKVIPEDFDYVFVPEAALVQISTIL